LLAAKLWLEHAAGSMTPSAAQPVARAVEELSRLVDGVESILHWAAGDGTIRTRRVDLASLVREAVDCCVAETGEDRVVVDRHARLFVKADALHLRSAIENLVRNALRYSTPGTKVVVTVEPRDGHPSVEVENEGPEIRPEDRERVFEPLAHGSVGGGTGLGLFVVRCIAERHGGTVRCHQPHEGHVAFELRLPAGAAA
jgi:signal transduction histidine kinase